MDIGELCNAVDIVDYIGQYVEFEEKNGEFWCLSPFKEERTPSFSVRRETGQWFDFSSGKSGKIINFIQAYHHCSFPEALEKLKSFAGLEGEEIKPREKLEATLVCKKYSRHRRAEKESNPTVYPPNYMDMYERNLDKLAVWEREGISLETLDLFQVRYDSFSDRLMYPIKDADGRIVNVGARTLDPDYKAKGISKYRYLSGWGGGMKLLYGLYENLEDIKRSREILIFEGAKSVMKAHTWGINNTAALLTSHVSDAQLKILASLGVRVVFALDKDVTIRDDKNIARLKQYVNVSYIWDRYDLLGEKDSPADVKTVEDFKRLYESKLRYS